MYGEWTNASSEAEERCKKEVNVTSFDEKRAQIAESRRTGKRGKNFLERRKDTAVKFASSGGRGKTTSHSLGTVSVYTSYMGKEGKIRRLIRYPN